MAIFTASLKATISHPISESIGKLVLGSTTFESHRLFRLGKPGSWDHSSCSFSVPKVKFDGCSVERAPKMPIEGRSLTVLGALISTVVL